MSLEQNNHFKRFPTGLVYVEAGGLFRACTAKPLMNELNFPMSRFSPSNRSVANQFSFVAKKWHVLPSSTNRLVSFSL